MKTVLINGKIYVERGVFAQAVYAEDGVICSVGTNEEVLAAAGKDAEVIDCGGKTVIPGLNDSHMHLLMIGIGLAQVDIGGVTSIDEMIERVKTFMEEHPEACKNGIHSVGWNQDLFVDDKRIPTRHDLDRISTEIPIVLERVCGHVVTSNTKAIEMLGLGPNSPQYVGGTFEFGPDGYPNGVFTEHACGYVNNTIPSYTLEEYERMFMNAMDYAVAHGITTVQSNDAGTAPVDADTVFKMIHKVYDEGRAKLRYHHQVCFHTPAEFKKYIENGEFKHGDYSHPWLTLGPLKLFKDGSLGGRTGTMRHEYLDDPGNYGVETTSDELMDEFCRMADKAGIQVVTHVIGDKAIADTVGNYERVLRDGKNTLRHGLVHCQITDLPLLERIARDGILAMYQPIFLDYDMHAVISRCGEELSRTSYAFGTLEKLGGFVSYGTDSPVEDCNPFPNLYSAVTRKDKNGWPEGGFFPEECVDVYTAVDAYTAGSAYAEFRENDKGRIKPGFAADLVVLDTDIFTCDPMNIRDILPDITIVGGKVVYQR
ncbi:MAG: amidohydrolase [Clostridium sp. SCN 57-10]|nr:MAG: amidohydrolase [Clostridium sp. SCN 57-10]